MQSETYLDLFILIWVHLTGLLHGCLRFRQQQPSPWLPPSLPCPPKLTYYPGLMNHRIRCFCRWAGLFKMKDFIG